MTKPANRDDNIVTKNPWRKLRCFTDARIGLGRTGISIPTAELLQFQLAHAQAIDAVHRHWDTEVFSKKLSNAIRFYIEAEILCLHSQAKSREIYLQRPDFGRCLSQESKSKLENFVKTNQCDSPNFDVTIVIVDGLSALAIDRNAIKFLEHFLPALLKKFPNLSIAPLTLVQQGRVAIGDDIGQALQSDCSIVLIGERPGLSSPDSMGLYLTWSPKIGRNDAQRNCISNIRPAGLSYQQATNKALYLFSESRAHQLSGVQIKDRTEEQQHIRSDKNTLMDESCHDLTHYF